MLFVKSVLTISAVGVISHKTEKANLIQKEKKREKRKC